jgi:glycosyltransferase involved in cell wall biosynthesis
MKIGIITTFQSFMPQYSLTGIVKDRAEMLTKYGHEVHLFVSERYHGEEFPADVILEKKIPFTHLADYHTLGQFTGEDQSYKPAPGVSTPAEHEQVKNQTAAMLREELKDYDLVFTEDIVFQGWHLPFAVAIMEASKDLPNVKWLHAIHSVPSAGSDFWQIKLYGKRHKLLYPNRSDALRVAEQYRGVMDDVRVIPHIKDIRSLFDYSEDTRQFIDTYPGVMQAEIVQIYPASVDRLEAKRLSEVLGIFGHFKRLGKSVCLVIATQWATGQKQLDIINGYKKQAVDLGLTIGTEVIFTPDFKPAGKEGRFGVGIPKHMIRELFQLSNVFIFPTREETFGLVLPEAALCGSPIVVLNGSLDMMHEVSGYNALFFDFGSFNRGVTHNNLDLLLRDIALIVLGRILANESVRLKTFMRRHYNYDYLYTRYYGPILQESRLWV